MKTLSNKLTLSLMSLFVLVALVILAANLAEKTSRFKTAAGSSLQQAPAITGNGYSEVMNNLFSSGR